MSEVAEGAVAKSYKSYETDEGTWGPVNPGDLAGPMGLSRKGKHSAFAGRSLGFKLDSGYNGDRDKDRAVALTQQAYEELLAGGMPEFGPDVRLEVIVRVAARDVADG